RAGIEMLDKSHFDIASEQRELDRAQFIEGPALSAAAGSDRFAPHCRNFFAQRFVLDLHQWWKKLRDFTHAVIHEQLLINRERLRRSQRLSTDCTDRHRFFAEKQNAV